MENQLPTFPVQSQNYIAPNSLLPQIDQNPQNPQNKSSNNKARIVTVILVILLLITLPIMFYFLVKQSGGQKSAKLAKDMNSINITPSVPTDTPTPMPTEVPIATNSGNLIATPAATWKTYTNTQYAFSIQYPATWYNSEFTDKTGSAFASTGIPTATAAQEIKIGAIAKVDKENLTFADYVKVAGINEFGYTKLASAKPITTTSGITGYEITWTAQDASESLPITYFEIPNNTKATIEIFLEKAADLDTYNQMLLSFKVTQ